MMQKSRVKVLEEVSRHPRSSAEGKSDLGTFVNTRASNVITHICATASFGLKMRIKKVRGNRERAAVSSHRRLCFS